MDRLHICCLFFPILMGVMVFQYRKELVFLLKNKLIEDPSDNNLYDLVIVVPSARDHFLQRDTIRNTWWSAVREDESLSERVLLKFAVGGLSCPHPPEYRLDEHSCEEWSPHLESPGDIASAKETSEPTELNSFERNYGQHRVVFKVDHPVIIDHLGIHKDSLVDEASVQLLDAFSDKPITSAHFDSTSTTREIDGYFYKSVEPYLLPKDFEGVIYASSSWADNKRLPVSHKALQVQLYNSSMIHFLQFSDLIAGHYDDRISWNANTIPVPAMLYHMHEMNDFQDFITKKTEQMLKYKKENENIDTLLKEEESQHGDLLLLDMVDVYRNIPQKVLESFKVLSSDFVFKFMLKTDDDCYLDVSKVLQKLNNRTLFHHKKKIWWGRFRHNWAVDLFGKWAERKYRSPVYPPFACGAGYVLSQKLVQWLSANSEMLNIYQGEDTSLGIWLAAVLPEYIDDPMWSCETECLSHMYAMPDLNPDRLHQFWRNQMMCGDPCGCT